MTIAMLAKKGGVGKSTMAVMLHEAFRQAGKSVAIHDWDVQGTTTKAMGLIGGQIAQPGRPYDILVYDTPPSLEHVATAAAAQSADVALVLTSPSPADVWEADEVVRYVRARNPSAAIRVLFTKVRKTTVLGRLVDESARQISAPALATSISARECYQHAIGQGWRALDSAAREEVLQLAVALLSVRA